MIKKRGLKRFILRLSLTITLVILLSVSLGLPFLNTNNLDLYLVHMFNPTSHPFNGQIESLYAFLVIILTYVAILLNFVPIHKQNERYKITALTIKTSTLFMFITAQTNYFRVIYPNSFIIDMDTSDFYVGFYIFISFMILYFLDLNLVFLRLYKGIKTEYNHIENKKERNFLTYVRISVGITLFAFISLLFVPFFRNYTSYMPEQGFEHILDKRTSVDYYFYCIYNKDFNLSLSGIIFIFTTILTPTILMFKNSRKTIKWIFVSSVLNIISVITGICVGLNNMNLITPIVELEVDGVCVFFITLYLLLTLITMTLTYLYLRYTKKNKEVKNDIN